MTSSADLPFEFLTKQELAELLKVDEKTIYRMVQSGKLPKPFRLSKRCLRFDRTEVFEWLKKSRR
jgi:excisionase family DNA binding protein